jgi:hypothetical protein
MESRSLQYILDLDEELESLFHHTLVALRPLPRECGDGLPR